MWKELKEKLPLKGVYTENKVSFDVTITDLKLTESEVTLKLKKDNKTFEASSDREYIWLVKTEKGLCIDAGPSWKIMLKK